MAQRDFLTLPRKRQFIGGDALTREGFS